MIPDVPYAVKEQIKREKYLTQVILHETNLKLVTKRLKPVDENKETEMKHAIEEMDLDFWGDCPAPAHICSKPLMNQRQNQGMDFCCGKRRQVLLDKERRNH